MTTSLSNIARWIAPKQNESHTTLVVYQLRAFSPLLTAVRLIETGAPRKPHARKLKVAWR